MQNMMGNLRDWVWVVYFDVLLCFRWAVIEKVVDELLRFVVF